MDAIRREWTRKDASRREWTRKDANGRESTRMDPKGRESTRMYANGRESARDSVTFVQVKLSQVTQHRQTLDTGVGDVGPSVYVESGQPGECIGGNVTQKIDFRWARHGGAPYSIVWFRYN